MNMLKKIHVLNIPYDKPYRSREAAIEIIFGNVEES